jgi:FAD/FMN-containing dehydrogenase
MRFVTRNIDGARSPFDKQYPWYVLLDVAIGDDSEIIEDELMQALQDGLCVEATIAKNLTEANEFWHLRHTISEAQKSEGASLKHDISVPIGKLHEFLREGDDLLAEKMPEARLVAFGHVGDGNLHYNVSQPANGDVDRFQACAAGLTDAIYTLVSKLGGSISAEHGIGTMKKDHLSRFADPIEIELMGTVKRALDPHNILNPGKVI